MRFAKVGSSNLKKYSDGKCPERCNRVGGQAVLEGVMMKAGEHTVTTCRKEDGSLAVYDDSFVSVRKKHKLLNLPILRGVINFVEMMKLSFKTMSVSADAMGLEEEEGRFEKWLKKHFGIGVTEVVTVIGVILGVALALFLFLWLPTFLAGLFDTAVGSMLGAWRAVLEGVMKIGIFLVYLWLVSLMPEIRRVFMYHGAEHKSIACFESGTELTPENAKNYTRFHPRCGTSFMFFMILIGIFAGLFIRLIFPDLPNLVYVLIRLLILPLVVGIGYEFIMYAGKHENPLTRALSAPGLWVQRLTTREPDLSMLEVAITSLKCALRDDFPEFKEFYESRPWEKKEESLPSDVTEEAANEADSAPLAEVEDMQATKASGDETVSPAIAEEAQRSEAEHAIDATAVTEADESDTTETGDMPAAEGSETTEDAAPTDGMTEREEGEQGASA